MLERPKSEGSIPGQQSDPDGVPAVNPVLPERVTLLDVVGPFTGKEALMGPALADNLLAMLNHPEMPGDVATFLALVAEMFFQIGAEQALSMVYEDFNP